jgi:hypothetical protein
MSDYTKITDFAAKDSLPTGDPDKVIFGEEHDDEYNAIESMSATKADKIAPAAEDNIATLDATGNLQDGGMTIQEAIDSVDFSEPAITGFVSGDILYLHEDGGMSSEIDVDAIIADGGAFESFGPTSAGATNTWTAMNDLPAGTRCVLLGYYCTASGAGEVTLQLYGRRTGQSDAIGVDTTIDFDKNANAVTLVGQYWQPLDTSRRFDFTYAISGESSQDLRLYLKGFMAKRV